MLTLIEYYIYNHVHREGWQLAMFDPKVMLGNCDRVVDTVNKAIVLRDVVIRNREENYLHFLFVLLHEYGHFVDCLENSDVWTPEYDEQKEVWYQTELRANQNALSLLKKFNSPESIISSFIQYSNISLTHNEKCLDYKQFLTFEEVMILREKPSV